MSSRFPGEISGWRRFLDMIRLLCAASFSGNFSSVETGFIKSISSGESSSSSANKSVGSSMIASNLTLRGVLVFYIATLSPIPLPILF